VVGPNFIVIGPLVSGDCKAPTFRVNVYLLFCVTAATANVPSKVAPVCITAVNVKPWVREDVAESGSSKVILPAAAIRVVGVNVISRYPGVSLVNTDVTEKSVT